MKTDKIIIDIRPANIDASYCGATLFNGAYRVLPDGDAGLSAPSRREVPPLPQICDTRRYCTC